MYGLVDGLSVPLHQGWKVCTAQILFKDKCRAAVTKNDFVDSK